MYTQYDVVEYTRQVMNEVGLELRGDGYVYIQGSESPMRYDNNFLKFSFDGAPTYVGTGEIVFDLINNPKLAECVFGLYLDVSRECGDFNAANYYIEYSEEKKSRVCATIINNAPYISDYFYNPALKYGDFILKRANSVFNTNVFEV